MRASRYLVGMQSTVSPPAPHRRFSLGLLSRVTGEGQVYALFPWPANCGIQGGTDGIVFEEGSVTDLLVDPAEALRVVAGAPSKPHYRTAFFEAFLRSPDTFIRGEGACIRTAEVSAWKQFRRIMDCSGHEWERRGYRHGQAVCKHCGMFGSRVLPTLDPCCVCGALESYGVDVDGRWHCKEHFHRIPEDRKTEMHKLADRLRA